MDRNTTVTKELVACDADNQKFWFCIQTHAKHEHIASAALAKVGGFEVFNPQFRIRRATKRGPVWFTESAFSGYIFARFNLQIHLSTVRYSASVSKVVHFNSGYPNIPDYQMNELQTIFGADEMVVLTPDVAVGDTVRIVGGAFHDLVAVVQQFWPAKQRVQALLDFLGRMTTVELDLHRVTVEERCQPPHHPLNRAEVSARIEIETAM
jgi:transcription antitermination factor NusG